MEVYVIKVTLLETRPPVWRRILVPQEITLRNLHRTLQTVMGWTNAHLHQFVLPGARNFGLGRAFGGKIGNENQTTLGALLEFPGAKLLYEYDFGDYWPARIGARTCFSWRRIVPANVCRRRATVSTGRFGRTAGIC